MLLRLFSRSLLTDRNARVRFVSDGDRTITLYRSTAEGGGAVVGARPGLTPDDFLRKF